MLQLFGSLLKELHGTNFSILSNLEVTMVKVQYIVQCMYLPHSTRIAQIKMRMLQSNVKNNMFQFLKNILTSLGSIVLWFYITT